MVFAWISRGLYALVQPKYYEGLEQHDPWHLPIILLFLICIAVNVFYAFFRWQNLLRALILTRGFSRDTPYQQDQQADCDQDDDNGNYKNDSRRQPQDDDVETCREEIVAPVECTPTTLVAALKTCVPQRRQRRPARTKSASTMTTTTTHVLEQAWAANHRQLQHQQGTSKKSTDRTGAAAANMPAVTVQICTYNEAETVAETIRCACQLDWPKSQLRVHVLDDSTDCLAQDQIARIVADHRARGFQILHLKRPERTGYKAGNLYYHFEEIDTDFVVYLDEDHRIQPNFLRKTVPYFYDSVTGEDLPDIGLVQTPWAYYNLHQSLLTETDALGLDIHHVLEQTGRSLATGCFGFNGTGGIWRKQAIEDAGGWTWSTVTEDLDLSYRAAVKGYRFVYVRSIPQPLEVPASFRAHIQQKSRWTKGYFQVFRFSYWNVLLSPNLSAFTKLEMFAHVTAGIQFVTIALALILYPFLVLHEIDHNSIQNFCLLPLVDTVLAGVCAIFAKVAVPGENYTTWQTRCKRIYLIFMHIAAKCGMSIFETKAVLEGLFSDDATFLSTPKGRVGKTNVKKLQKKHVDFMVAILGIVLGVHRLIYVLATVEYLAIATWMDAFFFLFNCTLCFGLFWINVGFLADVVMQVPTNNAAYRRTVSRSSSSSSSSGVSRRNRKTRLTGYAALVGVYCLAAVLLWMNSQDHTDNLELTFRGRVASAFRRQSLFFRPASTNRWSCEGSIEAIQTERRSPFVVFSMARSGSNLLSEITTQVGATRWQHEGHVLNLYELYANQIESTANNLFKVSREMGRFCLGQNMKPFREEVRNWTHAEMQEQPQVFIDRLQMLARDTPNAKQVLDMFDRRFYDPMGVMDFLLGVPSAYEKPIVALKVFDTHIPHNGPLQEYISSMSKEKGVKFAVLWRRRMIESYVSYSIAMRNKKWLLHNTTKQDQITIDRDALEHYIAEKRGYYVTVRNTMESQGLPFEVFEYGRDLVTDEGKIETILRLQQIFGLKSSNSPGDILKSLVMKKQAQIPLSDQVTNWDEVVEWGFGGELEEWEDLFANY